MEACHLRMPSCKLRWLGFTSFPPKVSAVASSNLCNLSSYKHRESQVSNRPACWLPDGSRGLVILPFFYLMDEAVGTQQPLAMASIAREFLIGLQTVNYELRKLTLPSHTHFCLVLPNFSVQHL